ncbi:MCE family protein [Pseudonocardia sp. GCM10023141]|uniref:MCE family protein n=1 Tax=Pseudonocardia sp. GCM10023141 TaxID=3252653 RepID=UPI0036190089
MKDTAVLIKLALFLVVTVLASVLVVNTLMQPLPRSTVSYTAQFTDAQGLTQGSDVRVAGVRVGQVESVSLRNGMAEVAFEVTDDQVLPSDAGAIVRYADLLGARYIAMTAGKGAGGRLAPDAMIPANRTLPAVDLTALLAGFQPLFESIDPAQVNQLAGSLVAVFQGESGTVVQLLQQVIAVTSTITDRDAVIGRVLDNLNVVISGLLGKQAQFTDLVGALTTLVQTAADERAQIGDVLDSASQLAGTLADVTRRAGPDLAKDVTSLHAVAAMVDENGNALIGGLQSVNQALNGLGRASGYGSWVNLYLCNLVVKVGPVEATVPPNVHSSVCR